MMQNNNEQSSDFQPCSTLRLPFPLQVVQQKSMKKKCCKKHKKGKRCKKCPGRVM